MKINYRQIQNMNETHISFEAIKRSGKQKQGVDVICKQKTNKRKNNVVRGFKRIAWDT